MHHDTAILHTDSVEARLIESASTVEQLPVELDYLVGDTILKNNFLSIDPDSVKALKNSESFAYAKKLDSLLIAYQQGQEREAATAKNKISWLNRFFLSPFTKYFFWMLALVFVSFILYKLFFTEGIFQRPFGTANVRVIEEETDPLLKNTDYGKLITGAVNTRNFRMAVRYHYLQSLQKLAQKGAIQLASDKTNYQYVSELSGKTYKHSFAALTLNYEYVWYGEFEIDENVFNTIQNKFKKFNSEV